MQSQSVCSKCGGSGEIIETPCKDCHGTGIKRKTVKINIDIPAGVDNDSVIPIRGQGEPGPHGGPSGDLYVVIGIRPHSTYKRKGDDLYLEMPISFEQAALGSKQRYLDLEKHILILYLQVLRAVRISDLRVRVLQIQVPLA